MSFQNQGAINTVPMTQMAGTSDRKFPPPSAGDPIAILADSNGDRTNDNIGLFFGLTQSQRYGSWITRICDRYGCYVCNENFIPNGSFEGVWVPALSGVDTPNGFFNCSASTTTNALTLQHGAQSYQLIANATTGAGMYAIVGGAAPALLTGTAPVAGAMTTPPTIFYAGRDMPGPKVIIGGPGVNAVISIVTFQGAIFAVRVDNGGTGYTNGVSTTLATIDPNSTSDNLIAHGTGGLIQTTVSGGVITAVSIAAPGSGYPDTPFWQAFPSNGVGTAASGFAYLNPSGGFSATFITNGGTGLTAAPNVVVNHQGPRYKNDGGLINRNMGLPAVQPGETWTLFGWVTGSGITGGNVYLQVIGAWPASANGARQALATGQAAGNPIKTLVSATFTVPAGFGQMEFRLGTSGSIGSGTSGVWVDGLGLVKGSNVPTVYPDYGTARGGFASQVFSSNGGGFGAVSNIGPRLTQYTSAKYIFLFHFINDLGNMSGSVAVGTRTTLAQMSTDFDTFFTAAAAMPQHPKVVVIGLPPWGSTIWNATVPPGFRDYSAAADAMELLIMQKCVQYGALYVPARRYMDPNMIYGNGQANQVHISDQGGAFLASLIEAYLEGNTY
jgi:hypothetical protein